MINHLLSVVVDVKCIVKSDNFFKVELQMCIYTYCACLCLVLLKITMYCMCVVNNICMYAIPTVEVWN